MATNKKVYMEVTCVEVEEGVGLDEKGRVLAPPFSHMLRHIKDEDEEEPVSPSTSGVGHAVRLYHYNELPNFLRGNPFITSGYRVYLPTRLCLKSMFSLTNETFNIWTHVLGFVYFSLVLLEDNIVLIPEAEGNYGDHFTFSIMNICYLACLFFSAGFHLFNCQSEVVSKVWFGLDLMGISIGLIGCYFPGAYYAFYCHHTWQMIYMFLLILAAMVTIALQIHPDFLSNKWHFRRLLLYSGLALMGVVPMTHWIVLNGGLQSGIVRLFIPRTCVSYILGITGGLFYITKFPERHFPGKFNTFGSSHQWWHVLVLLSFWWTHNASMYVFRYWRKMGCDQIFLM